MSWTQSDYKLYTLTVSWAVAQPSEPWFPSASTTIILSVSTRWGTCSCPGESGFPCSICTFSLRIQGPVNQSVECGEVTRRGSLGDRAPMRGGGSQ